MLSTICFDADDTLWHNERFFKLTQARFQALLAPYADPADLEARLLRAERRNIEHYGFGIKGFTLSMIETACDVTENRVPGEVIAQLIAAGQEMLRHPIELLPGAETAVRELREDYSLLLITKGDLLDQERKIAQSGLGEMFDGVEIVSEKSVEVYRGIFTGRGLAADNVVMVGNSLKSDVNPVIEAGGWGVFVPHDLQWDLEAAEAPRAHPRFREIRVLGELPGLIRNI
ncbi:MAG: HAD family hydrolase [Silicimonas sp.]|nr:HAD family hydrolase [Silicimonas sp.]